MTYSSLLVNTCTTERYTSVNNDAYGQPIKLWVDYLIDEPCRISYPRGRQIQRETEIVPVEAVLFMDDVDVTEHDRVTVDTILYEILFVARLQDGTDNHHKELSLKRVIP